MTGDQSIRSAAAFEGFTVEHDGERLSCARAIPYAEHPAQVRQSVVLLHGAGTGSKQRLVGLMSDSAARGYQAHSFDFSGHGDSSGRLGELSLERRFVQARAVIDSCVPADHRLVLVGFSMSGHTVADLATHYGGRVQAIGLCAPAVYAAEAWSVPFAAGFTEIIRTPDSWRRSPALEVFRALTARAVLATPAVDEVIPEAVTEAVAEALSASPSLFTRLVYPRADHKLGLWFQENAAERKEFLDAVLA
ncbi:alpha/beta hydrolase [Yinghuangia seranimata]|uniref:alpha/beta hydrolase n=1 Tax=Yinghuangia seranimata TaxID=408067 RepID=UPI00248B4F5E|nr:alpha/beta fold hydrolase [Yinghuangia seranimata]MDI2125518.1 alpha/beta fold hydrolase [Yinghuangia seranimata]